MVPIMLRMDFALQAVIIVVSLSLAILAAVVPETPKKRGIYEGTTLAFIALGVGYLLTLTYITLPNITNYLPLVEKLHTKKDLAEALQMLKTADDNTDMVHNKVMASVVDDIITKFKDDAKKAQDGEFRIDKCNTITESLKLIQLATNRILSTSFVSAVDWWRSADGKNYQSANYTAAHKGVKIERVFIFKDEQQKKDAEDIMREQVDNGVNVCFAYKNELAKWFSADLLVIDSIVAGEMAINGLTQEPGDASMSTKEGYIKEITDKYRQVGRQASVYREGAPNCGSTL